MTRLTRRTFLKQTAAGAALAALGGRPAPAHSALAQGEAETPFLVVDAHEDIAWNMLNHGRDYTRSAYETRAIEGTGIAYAHNAGICTLGLPEWLAGQVGVIAATVFVMPVQHSISTDVVVYATPDEAHDWGMRELDAYEALAEATGGQVRLIDTAGDLDAVVRTWAPDADPAERRIGLLRSMEGADPIREPAEVGAWFERGLRIIGPSWRRTRYGGGTWEPGPLTDLGRALLDEMAALGMMLDLSHASDQTFLEALDHYDGVVLASHSNPRAFCPGGERCPNDEMIARLAERGGVIGVVLYNAYLSPDWTHGDGRTVALDAVVDVIDHICQRLGGCANVGIGSDFDGGLGWENNIPRELDTVADLLLIGDALRARGYTEEDVKAIMGGNWLRLYREGLPA